MALPVSFERLLESLDLTKTTITRPKRVVFVCGGPYASRGEFQSIRDVIVRDGLVEQALPDVQPLLAERASEKFKTIRGFVDLLQFERVIANVSEGVLLIIEGPGAIAELGAFAIPSEIREKLYVAVDSGLHDGSSFISAGVITYIEERTGRPAHGVPGMVRRDGQAVNARGAPALIAGFKQFVESQAQRRTVSQLNEQVKYCLIFFIVLALRGSYLSQIMEALARFGYNDVKNQDLKQILSILELVGWIRERRLGDQPFWFPILDVNPLDASFVAGGPVQDLRRGLSDVREEVIRENRGRVEEFARVLEDQQARESANVAA